jgi:hypothetical protein
MRVAETAFQDLAIIDTGSDAKYSWKQKKIFLNFKLRRLLSFPVVIYFTVVTDTLVYITIDTKAKCRLLNTLTC